MTTVTNPISLRDRVLDAIETEGKAQSILWLCYEYGFNYASVYPIIRALNNEGVIDLIKVGSSSQIRLKKANGK